MKFNIRGLILKKIMFIQALLLAIIITTAFPVRTYAFQMGIGAYSYYNWRDFAWTDAENLEMEPLLQAGPVLNMTWDNTISLSISAIIPTGIRHADFDYKPLVSNYNVHVDDANINKMDADAALSFLISPGLKIFGGIKYMKFSLMEGADTFYTGVNRSTSAVISNGSEDATDSFMGAGSNAYYRNSLLGGALGLNYSLPLYETLSLVSNISVLYMLSTIESTPILYTGSGFAIEGESTLSGSYKSPGANIALGLAYYLDSINTTLNIGGRYQVLYNIYSSGDYKGSDKELDETWGITCFAMVFMNFFQE